MPGSAQDTDWDDLRILLAVIRKGSFLAAAKELDLAVSTVSRRIAQFEARSGSALVERRSDGAHPTPAGRELAELANRVELDIAATLRAGGSAAEALKGIVRLSVGDGFTRLMIEAVAAFSSRHPGVEFEFIVENRAADLRKREADLAVRTIHKQEPSLIYRRLAQLDYGLVASPRYIERFGMPATPAELPAHTFVGFAAPLDRHMTMPWLASLGAKRFACRTTSFRSALAAVRAGLGIGALPRRAAGELVAIFPTLAPEPLQLYLVTHPEALRRPEVRAFVDAVVRDIGARLASR